jgi:hypothetical protein
MKRRSFACVCSFNLQVSQPAAQLFDLLNCRNDSKEGELNKSVFKLSEKLKSDRKQQ